MFSILSLPPSSLSASGVQAGTYGSSTACPVITVNDRGQVTNATTAALASSTPTLMAMLEFTFTSASATSAGTVGTSGTVPFNTVPANDINLSLSNNQFRLEPGTYVIDTTIFLVGCTRARILLFNATDNAVVKHGTTASSTDADCCACRLAHRFTITQPKSFEIDVQTNSATAALGYNANFTTQPESFAQVMITSVLTSITPTVTQVNFYAYSTAGSYSATGKLPFDLTLQNIGVGYDPTTYVFTAPYGGAYYLYFTLFVLQGTQTQDSRASMYWQSGSTTTLVTHVHAGNDYTSLSGSATLVLNAGDTVWVENESTSAMTLVLQQGHSYFGGYFIGVQNVLATSTSSTTAYALLALSSTPASYPSGTTTLAWTLVTGSGITLESSTNFRIANAGVYKFEMSLNSDHSTTGACLVTLESSVNGTSWTTVNNYDTNPGAWNGDMTLPFHGMAVVTANQLWRLRLNNSTNGATTWSSGTSPRYSRCMIYRVA